MKKKCSGCGTEVTLARTATFVHNGDTRLKACRDGDEIWSWVDGDGDTFGCQTNQTMRHNVNGLITEIKRGGTTVGRTRKG